MSAPRRAVLDACVLTPLVARECLFAAAHDGRFAPVWSDRIVEEWRRAAAKTQDAAFVDGDVALARAAFPAAERTDWAEHEGALSLPDWNDRHVLAAAIAAGAEVIVTDNLRDFPRRTLAAHGVEAVAADAALADWARARPASAVARVDGLLARWAAGGATLARSDALGAYAALKRARLPRFARALADAAPGG